MDQALRGIALTTLSAGQDISDRITQLYAPPGAWSHGLLWGADVVEIPADDPTFEAHTDPITVPNTLQGGVVGGANADWYSFTMRGVAEVRAVLELLRGGVDGEVAEAAFTSTSGGPMPAGSLIFPTTAKEPLAAAGKVRQVCTSSASSTRPKPATTQLDEAPKVAMLVNGANADDERHVCGRSEQIFGADANSYPSLPVRARSRTRRPIRCSAST